MHGRSPTGPDLAVRAAQPRDALGGGPATPSLGAAGSADPGLLALMSSA
jgi:hypothetical protein